MLELAKKIALKQIKETLPKASSVLDVGFGNGEFIRALLDSGYFPLGVDSSYEACLNARSQFPGDYYNWDTVPEELDGEVKTTTCFEVIEHLEKPERLLRTFPKGPTIFSIPNPNRWWVKLTRNFETWDYPPNHLRRYTPEELASLLDDCSFYDIDIKQLPVHHSEILQPIYGWLFYKLGILRNSGSSGIKRRKLHLVSRIVRIASYPITATAAYFLTKAGYKGMSMLAYAVKK